MSLVYVKRPPAAGLGLELVDVAVGYHRPCQWRHQLRGSIPPNMAGGPLAPQILLNILRFVKEHHITDITMFSQIQMRLFLLDLLFILSSE